MDSNTQKQYVTSIFDTVAEAYDNPATRFFPFSADRLVNRLKPRRNSKVLDIACGTGAVATALAPLLLPEGRVQAIDLSERMLDVAEQKLRKLGLSNIDLHVMDAERLDFRSDYFDAITCSYGLFFIPDMQQALREWLRVLKPDGRIIFTSFSQSSFSPLGDLFLDRIADLGIEVDKARWQRLATTDSCEEILAQCDFSDIEVGTEQLGYHLASEQDWWELCWSTGFRGFLQQLDPQQLTRFREQHLQDVAQHKTDKGVWLNIETIFAVAKK